MEPTIIEFQQTRDFSRKMNASFEFIKQNFKPLMKALLFIAGPPVLVGSILMGTFYSRFLTMTMQMGADPGNTDLAESYFGSAAFWLEITGAIIFLFVGTAVTVATVVCYMSEYNDSKTNKISVDVVWSRVKKKLMMYIGTMILYSLGLLLLYVLLIIPVTLFAAITPFLIVFAVIGMICLIVYVAITFSLVFIIRGYEPVGFFAAVSRAFYLIKGKWWSTFGLLFVMGLIQSMVSSVFFVPWYINIIISSLHSLETNTFQEPSAISQLINNIFLILYFLSSFLLYALPLIALNFQYFNLVEMKEARGLLSKIDTIGQTPEPSRTDDQY